MEGVTFEEVIKAIGVVAVGTALLLRVILPYLGGKAGKSATATADAIEDLTEEVRTLRASLETNRERIRDLHQWHSHEVQPGIMNWWILDEDRERWKRIERQLERIAGGASAG